jgi:plastocyanin
VSKLFPSSWSRCSLPKDKPGDCLRFVPADSLSGHNASWLASLATMQTDTKQDIDAEKKD